MRIHVVSDVHGSADALARAGEGADVFICLGDLILFLDYAKPALGIFGSLFGAANTQRYIDLRTAGQFDEARTYSATLWDEAIAAEGTDLGSLIRSRVRAQYSELFASMPTPAFLTYGNVDLPHMWPEFLQPGHTVLDGEVVEIGGLRFGFVGGGLISPMHTPYELDEDTFDAKVAALGEVDVLCSHIPPALPELTYDVVARRFEHGSAALLELIRRTQPRYSLFGHVHQPLAARARIGRTECVNVGHFRAGETPFALTW